MENTDREAQVGAHDVRNALDWRSQRMPARRCMLQVCTVGAAGTASVPSQAVASFRSTWSLALRSAAIT